MEKQPAIPLELIEYLEAICPDKSPNLRTPEREVWFNAGRADLVTHLRLLFDEQNLTQIEGSTHV